MATRRRITAAFIGLLVLVVGGWFAKGLIADSAGNAPGKVQTKVESASGSTSSSAQPTSSLAGSNPSLSAVALSGLPQEAQDTWRLVQSKGPFPYPHDDGKVFANREKLLPLKPSTYYHEYTVKTPGESTRGARRLITGQSKELYYTDDHYGSFQTVDPGR